MGRWVWGLVLVPAGACGGPGFLRDDFGGSAVTTIGSGGDDGGGVDDREVERSADVPPPISGGTLLVLADRKTVVAADPDRDLVHVASLDGGVLATIMLEPGDEPGRAVEDDGGLVHVALRGAGALVSIDTSDCSIAARQQTCANPRGVAFDPARGVVLVACAGGELVAHPPAGAMGERLRVAPDLRDVLVHDGSTRVSRFRTAEVLAVDANGAVLDSAAPPMTAGQRVASTSWRTSATPDGGWLMVHQTVMTTPIDLEPADDFGAPSYGGGGGGNPTLASCDGPVSAVLSVGRPTGDIVSSERLALSTLAVDAAMSPDGRRIAVAIAGQHDEGSETMERQRSLVLVNTAMLSEVPDADCHDPEDVPLPGHIVAVAFVDDDTVVAQSREPAALFVVSVPDRSHTMIGLPGESRRDTGHDLFHQDAGVGLACASCHPEGGDDGRVWIFAPGPFSRRTQSLRVGLAGTEPFHWSGDLPDFATLTSEVHSHRMGAAEQSAARTDAFRDWVFGIAPSNSERTEADALVLQGYDVFVALQCDGCHTDQALAEGKTVEMGGQQLQVPSLRGVALRPPYMHDGRVGDLGAAVLDMMQKTDSPAMISAEDLAAVVAYLESL